MCCLSSKWCGFWIFFFLSSATTSGKQIFVYQKHSFFFFFIFMKRSPWMNKFCWSNSTWKHPNSRLFCFKFIGINPSFVSCYDVIHLSWGIRVEFFKNFPGTISPEHPFQLEINYGNPLRTYFFTFKWLCKMKCMQDFEMFKDISILSCIPSSSKKSEMIRTNLFSHYNNVLGSHSTSWLWPSWSLSLRFL